MDGSENRQIARDSLFVLADLRIDGQGDEHRIKVRNLSAGGMMGEGLVRVTRGALVQVKLRNLGWVDGTVAWVQESRFGVAFRDEIDPGIARIPLREGEDVPLARRPSPSNQPGGPLRKI